MKKVMTPKFRLYRRGSNGRFYLEYNITGKQESLGTSNKAEAMRLLMAKNEADHQPAFNAQIARTYLAAGDPALARRTWKEVIAAFIESRAHRLQNTRDRYDQAFREPVLARFGARRLLDTRPEDILHWIKEGTVSTNMYFRRLHSFALTLVGCRGRFSIPVSGRPANTNRSVASPGKNTACSSIRKRTTNAKRSLN